MEGAGGLFGLAWERCRRTGLTGRGSKTLRSGLEAQLRSEAVWERLWTLELCANPKPKIQNQAVGGAVREGQLWGFV